MTIISLILFLSSFSVQASPLGCITGDKVTVKPLGVLGDTQIHLTTNIDEGEDVGEVKKCLSMNYIYKNTKHEVELRSYSEPETEFIEETILIKGSRIVVSEVMSDRYSDETTISTKTYTLDLPKGKLNQTTVSEISGTEKRSQEITALLKEGKMEDALSSMMEINFFPERKFITQELFARIAPLFIENLKRTGSKEKKSAYVKQFLEIFVMDEKNVPFSSFMESKTSGWAEYEAQKNAQLWNDLAFHLEQGGELSLAQEVLSWLLTKCPFPLNRHHLIPT